MLDNSCSEQIADVDALWDDNDLCRFMHCGRTSAWKIEQLPDFPAPIRLGKRFKRHVPQKVRAWLESQQEAATKLKKAA